jgi:hypothetical protein
LLQSARLDKVYIVNLTTPVNAWMMQVLENSFEADSTAATDPQKWIQGWTQVVTAVTTNAVAAPRTIISILGNPDAGGLKYASPHKETRPSGLGMQTGGNWLFIWSSSCQSVHIMSSFGLRQCFSF